MSEREAMFAVAGFMIGCIVTAIVLFEAYKERNQ